jgi:hypothetical protein
MDYKIQVKAGFICDKCDNTAVLRPETKDMFSLIYLEKRRIQQVPLKHWFLFFETLCDYIRARQYSW